MLVKGPFEVKYGADVLAGIETIELNTEINNEDLNTIQGKSYQVTTSKRISASITLLESDIEALAVVLPQYFVPNGGTLSTGETVNDADGAIDITAGTCSDANTATDLVITSCGAPGVVLRIPECETEFENVTIDSVNKVVVTFRGVSPDTIAQFFNEGAVTIVS